MAVYKTVALDSPAAHHAAEAHGIVFDLEGAADTCRLFLDDSCPPSTALREAIATAAVIRYCRCFSSGIRPRMPSEIIDSLDDRKRAIHSYIRNLRNKFLAHSENPYEQNFATVLVPEDPDPAFKIGGLGFQQERFGYPSKELMKDFLELIEEVHRRAADWVHRESALAIDEANRIGVTELAKKDLISASGLPNAWECVALRRREIC